MRRSIIILALCSLFLAPLMAQEAFYIYRNDGDFNGFFYDEVVEMRYSKLALDSTEYEQYVTYEVELADTIYRIPLGAIDSIGFQQPEIKLNPKVKFIERDGLMPYFTRMNYNNIRFDNVPDELMPQKGDVLIGLPTDEGAEEKYATPLGNTGEGSFSCVVERVDVYNSGQYILVIGHPVEEIGDVFEQYITVEQIGVDKAGKVCRRVAGCTPEGLPRRSKASDDGHVDLTLIDVDGTLTRSWNPEDDISVDLSADISVKLEMRAVYNISWTRFYVKVTKDLSFSLKPSLGLAVSRSWEANLADWFDAIPGIGFPAACPVLETKPVPSFFMRAEGKLEARLNMPKVNFGFGDEIIMDSNDLFPLSYSIHQVPDDGEVSDEMLDLSAQVELSGSAQMGVQLKAPISTASWFKKVLYAEAGMYLYIGPKVGGRVHISTEVLNSGGIELYNSLASSYLYIALLSFDLEAKAKAAAFWNDPKEKTFFSKNWTFLTDTAFLVTKFKTTKIVKDENTQQVTIQIRPTKDRYFGAAKVEIGLYDYNTKQLVKKLNNSFDLYQSRPDSVYEYTLQPDEVPFGHYYAAPILTCGSKGPFEIMDRKTEFWSQLKLELESDTLIFESDGGEQSIEFTTNCPMKDGSIQYLRASGKGWWCKGQRIEVVDEAAGKYRAVFSAQNNNNLFDRRIPKNQKGVYLIANGNVVAYIGAYQKAPDGVKSRINATIYASFYNENNVERAAHFYDIDVITVTRQDSEHMHLEGTQTTPETNGYIYTYHFEGDVQRNPNAAYDPYGTTEYIYSNCQISEHFHQDLSNGEISEYTTVITFASEPNDTTSSQKPLVTSGTYDAITYKSDGSIKSETHEVWDGVATSVVIINSMYAYKATQ